MTPEHNDLKSRLQAAAAKAVHSIYDLDIDPASLAVQRTNKQHTGDFTVIVFPLMRHKLGRPEEVGERLGQALQAELEEIESFDVVKGFLNLRMATAYWLRFLETAQRQGEDYFRVDTGQGEQVMVEYSSPNTNKPLHLGHLRNIFLGDAICRLLEASGHRVVRANLINDRGIHIAKSMLAYQRFGAGETPESSGMKGDKLVGTYYVEFDRQYRREVAELIAAGHPEEQAKQQAPLLQAAQEMHRQWEAGDPDVHALWQKMNGWVYEGFEQTYDRLGVHFDRYYYESETYLPGRQLVEEGLQKGVFYRKDDGSVWVDLSEDGLDEKLLLRADGTSVYITQDLGTAQQKFRDYDLDRSLYVIGNEQDYHMKVLSVLLERLGMKDADRVIHISYGMVDLTSGKMKSREGTVVDADDLLDEMEQTSRQKTKELGKTEGLRPEELDRLFKRLSLGALKYFLLKVEPTKRMLFDPEESIDFRGDTGVFIQYGHARLCSILRKAADAGWTAEPTNSSTNILPTTEAIELLHELHHFPEVLTDAAQAYDPARMANHAYEVARAVGHFLYEVPVLRAPDDDTRQFRLALVEQARRSLEHSMRLLGIEVPEQM